MASWNRRPANHSTSWPRATRRATIGSGLRLWAGTGTVATRKRATCERSPAAPPSGLLRRARSGLLGGRLLRRGLAGGRLLDRLARGLLHRPTSPLVGEQLVPALRAELLGVVVLAQRRVG